MTEWAASGVESENFDQKRQKEWLIANGGSNR